MPKRPTRWFWTEPASWEGVVFTRDADFLREGARRQRAGIRFAGVIYAHQRVTIGRCVEVLREIAETGAEEEVVNSVTYVSRR